jgi:hypothetical protein
MIRQYLPNNNEKCYSAILQKKLHLNRPLLLQLLQEWLEKKNAFSVHIGLSIINCDESISTWLIYLYNYHKNGYKIDYIEIHPLKVG